jgi:hypothetical protein
MYIEFAGMHPGDRVLIAPARPSRIGRFDEINMDQMSMARMWDGGRTIDVEKIPPEVPEHGYIRFALPVIIPNDMNRHWAGPIPYSGRTDKVFHILESWVSPFVGRKPLVSDCRIYATWFDSVVECREFTVNIADNTLAIVRIRNASCDYIAEHVIHQSTLIVR